MKIPTIGITIGDPAGIGPEIVVKALHQYDILKRCRIVILGTESIIRKQSEAQNIDIPISIVRSLSTLSNNCNILSIFDPGSLELSSYRMGKVQAECGQAAYDYIRQAVELARAGHIDALVTAPIHKESLQMAGISTIGHTEILADLTNSTHPFTMFEVHGLRVFFLSRHLSLRQAINFVTRANVFDALQRSQQELRKLGVPNPKIAVAGLNPHCGENGRFGTEETEEIIPAIADACKTGIDVIGPIAADSIFHLGKEKQWDGILSLYHDQGHIATKSIDFHKTVSITLGLPFLRTSVDHGTAMDIAGKGIANPESMYRAILTAIQYLPYYQSE